MRAPQLILPHEWVPRFYQRPLWEYLKNGGLRAVAIDHRRAGKDDISLNHTACAAHERVGNYVHLLPEYSQARKAIWDAVSPHTGQRRIDQAFPLEIRRVTRENEMMIQFHNGSTWQLAGSDNYNALMGTSFAGMVFSEYALSNPEAWGYFSPILLENGGWALFITTPRGHNHAEAMLKTAKKNADWYWEVLTVDDTNVFTPEQMAEELGRLQDLHGEEFGRALWSQEYMCSFDAAIPGAIWADCIIRAEQDGRICDFTPNRTAKVDTGWDLGRTDDTAIWFTQPFAAQVDVIDHHSSNLKDIPYYVDLLLKRREELDITYGTHWLPHDARPRTLAAGGKSILQQFEDAAKREPRLGKFAIAPRLDRQEGIQAARATFPVCRFHRTRTAKGLENLRQYHREWDEEKKMFRDAPAHDFSSHDADAWRTVATTWKLPRSSAFDNRTTTERLVSASITGKTYGQMRDTHLRKRKAARELQS